MTEVEFRLSFPRAFHSIYSGDVIFNIDLYSLRVKDILSESFCKASQYFKDLLVNFLSWGSDRLTRCMT